MATENKPRLLIVEDEEDIQSSLRVELEQEGFVVDTAANGAEALKKLATGEPPDLVLLDLLLPVMDGWQFLKEWSARDGAIRTPVIALSAVAYRGAPGAVAALPKPIDFSRLVELIHLVRARKDEGGWSTLNPLTPPTGIARA